MIKDNIKGLLFWIFVVVVLLVCCMAIDYADEDISVTVNQSQVNVSNCTEIDGVHYDNKIVKSNSTGIAKVHKIVHIKPKYPTITMTGKPSCSCGKRYSYRWYTRTYVNYCPYCHSYGTLYNAHKFQARFEKEITCKVCGSDWCIVCGKEKYNWSKRYLRRA